MTSWANAGLYTAVAADSSWLATRVLARLSGYPDEDSCWLWTGPGSPYGSVHASSEFGYRTLAVHRVVWVSLRGPLPAEFVLDHHGPGGCRDKMCANPKHLDPVSQRVNIVDRGDSVSAINARLTSCRHGHPLTPENLVRNMAAKGLRKCRTCHREQSARQHQAIREARRALGLTMDEYSARYGWSEAVARSLVAGEVGNPTCHNHAEGER